MKQNQSIKVLIDGLKSRGIWVGGDPQAFQFSQMQDVESDAALFDEAKESYLKLAEELGIQTGSENLGQLPMDWFRHNYNNRAQSTITSLCRVRHYIPT